IACLLMPFKFSLNSLIWGNPKEFCRNPVCRNEIKELHQEKDSPDTNSC
ncbi:4748_t:CDS:1, partial [Gigaspora rosea]